MAERKDPEKGGSPPAGGGPPGRVESEANASAEESAVESEGGTESIPNGEATDIVSTLRERAERLLASAGKPAWDENLSENDGMRLLHELQVHQIELEMQNEELRRAQIDLALAAERYSDLFDFAPVGYLSIALDGQIVRANLTSAAMLHAERRELTGKSFYRFLDPADVAQFHNLRRRLVVPDLTESIDLRLQPLTGEPFWARLEIVTRQDPTEDLVLWQLAFSNIDSQKRAELVLQKINEELELQVERRTEQLTLSNRQLISEIDLRREAEAELRQREGMLEERVEERTEQLAAMLSVARDITSTLDIESVLEIILRELRAIVPYTGCAIFLLHGQMLTLVAYNGPLQRDGLLQSQTTLEESPLLNTVIKERQPLLVPDILEDTNLTNEWQRHAGSLQRQLMNRSRCWLGVPLIAQNQPVGVLRLDHVQRGYFTEQHVDVVFTLASQAAIAVVNARLFEQAQRVAAVEERQRLARELHDSVAQTFYSIALATHSARAQLGQKRRLAERRLDHILELADAGLTEMKALIFDLQAEGIRRDGLVQALRRHVDAISARNDIRVFANLGTEPAATIEAKEAVYGIAREALQNVIRHAAATELTLELSRSDDILCIEVRDNGKGFSSETVGLRTLGLRSMQERATATGGSVEISSEPGKGAVVRARIPAEVPSGAERDARGPGA